MSGKRSLARKSTSDHVREVLTQRILDGEYAPGDRIIELDVARDLGTSQAPVREALRELQGLRLVEVRPYRGARVRELSDDEVRESFDVRAVLEEFACRRAAGGADFRALRTAIQDMRAAAQGADCDAFVHADLAFHRAIVHAADHGTLLRVWESVGIEVWIRVLLKRSGVDLRPVADAHVPILTALENGDIETAARLLRNHPEALYGPDAVA